MRPTLWKRFSILFITICILLFTAQAQDSTQAVAPATKIPSASQAKTGQTQAPTTGANTGQSAVANSQAAAAAPAPQARASQSADLSIKGQYEDLLKYSWMQQGYKVVNPARLTNLWKTVSDSLTTNAKLLLDAKETIKQQQLQIEEITKQRNENPSNTETATQTVSQIHILGMLVNVGTYNWIMLGLIFCLAIALAIVSFKISKNTQDAKYYKQLFSELTDEYHAYKVKANDKEKRLARELQTERNTLEDLREELANKK